MTDSATDALLAAVAQGVRTVELGQPLFTGMPCSPNHPGFRMTLQRRHGDQVRPDGGSASNELIVMGGHVGTHIDGLAHYSVDGKMYGGVDATAALRGDVNGAIHGELGAETIPPMVTRGVLLDVAGTHGVDILDGGYGITADDLTAAADRAGAQPGAGDVALVRTGWARKFDDATAYLGHETGVPGVTTDGADWLAAHGVVAAGSDTMALEQIKAGQGHLALPVHRRLLVDSGIHIIELMNLEDAAAEGLTEFLFILLPLRIVGGTGSTVRPVAVIGA